MFLLRFLLLSLPNNIWRLIVFAPFIIIIIITSPRLLSGDVLLFYVSFSLLFLFLFFHTFFSTRFLGDVLLFYISFSLLLLHHPDCCRVMYSYSTFLFHYYSYSSTHFSPLDFSEMPWSTLWNLVGISYAMWSCAFKGWFFKMAAVAMETAKMLKNWKTQKRS